MAWFTLGMVNHRSSISTELLPEAATGGRVLKTVWGLALAIPLLLVSACNGCGASLVFEDDLGETGVNAPYGVGGTAIITVKRPQLIGAASDPNWTATSSDESVFVVDLPRYEEDGEESTFRVNVVGIGEGSADLIITSDDGQATEHGRQPIEVVQADGVRIAAADHFWDGTTNPTGVPETFTEVRVVQGTNVTLLTDVTKGGTPVYGRGIVRVATQDPALSSSVESTHFGRARDWILMNRTGVGSGTLEVSLGPVAFREIEIVSVDASAIEEINLVSAPSADANEDDPLAVVCTAKDDEDRPVYGAPCQWQFDGASVDREGTILTYAFAPGTNVEVSARLDDDRVAEPVSVEGKDPAVRDADKLGCSATSTKPVAPVLALLLAITLRSCRRSRRDFRSKRKLL